ncbi:3c6f0dd1-d81e-4f71-bcb0-e14963a4849d [Thermothielavioides terrestris]|uniref:3c6f0dd1-d81e-4f71-bcb0-e14963a4849d n=1 Tax=Thermothielavioides terrestris TaxID=2587410 RepID=A0A3S4EUU9_9PEZI|nr:3c6f0dd1-d81e-4f71-bcb0-e14963a4849d [Thermothielavioides terrestris]
MAAQCDGEFPCKRCKDDGLICTAGTRKKTEYKQLPPGYAEVLENTQFVLIATVQKLYSMVRNGEPWEFGEPALNERGQPIVHNVAAKLGCLRPNNDLDLPIQSIFPEDEAGMAELARQLREQQQKEAAGNASQSSTRQETESSTSSGGYNRTDRASSSAASDLEHSDFEFDTDYRKAAFGGAASALSMSPASLSYGGDFDIAPPSADGFPPPSLPSPTMPTQNHHNPTAAAAGGFQPWTGTVSRPPSVDFTGAPPLWMGQSLLEPSSLMNANSLLGANYEMKPQVFSSSCRNPEIMMGMSDPTIFSGFDDDTLRPAF